MESERFEGWFIVELMGHRKLGGFVREQAIAGTGFLRIDVPPSEEQGPVTQYFRPDAVYALTPTTEEIARATAVYYRPEPVSRFEIALPALEHGRNDLLNYDRPPAKVNEAAFFDP